VNAAKTVAWERLRQTLQAAIGFSLKENLELAEEAALPDGHASTLRLVDVQREVEIDVTLLVSRETACEIAGRMLGEAVDDDEMAGEFVSELTNIVMGSIKESFCAEGFDLTSGLPHKTTHAELAEIERSKALGQRVALEGTNLDLVVFVGLSWRGTSRVPVKRLTEGMVLARDLLNARGVLMLRAGERLSSSLVERLSNHGADLLAEVC